MGKQTLKQRLVAYDALEEANYRAIDALKATREAVDSRDTEALMENYISLLQGIRDMIVKYKDIGTNSLDCFYVLSNLEQTTGDSLEELCREMSNGETPEFDFYQGVEALAKSFVAAKTVPNVQNCTTLHELIRYLHSAGLQSLFSGEDLEDSKETKAYGSDTFETLRADEGVNTDLLEAMHFIYEKELQKQGRENYNLVLTKNRMMARINLGCHFSCLELMMKDGEIEFEVRFFNTPKTSYALAPFRGEYVKKVLEKLGFNDFVEGEDTVFGTLTGVSRKDLPKTTKEVIRLLASTKDLDLSSSQMDKHVDIAVKAFFEGVTNMAGYLCSDYSSNYIEPITFPEGSESTTQVEIDLDGEDSNDEELEDFGSESEIAQPTKKKGFKEYVEFDEIIQKELQGKPPQKPYETIITDEISLETEELEEILIENFDDYQIPNKIPGNELGDFEYKKKIYYSLDKTNTWIKESEGIEPQEKLPNQKTILQSKLGDSSEQSDPEEDSGDEPNQASMIDEIFEKYK